jgi:glycosyltransferase involved in cell wall biosynthesis
MNATARLLPERRREAYRTPVPELRRFKVLQVGKFYPPHMGGIETHLQTLCTELAKSCDLRVVVASDGHTALREIVDGVPVLRLPVRFTLASTPLCSGMASAIRRSDAEIVHLHLPNPMAVVAFLAGGQGKHLVVTYHSDTIRQKVLGLMFEPLLHAALRRSSAIIVTSPNYLSSSPVLAHHRDLCHVIPLGIDLEQFENCDFDTVSALRRKYGTRIVLGVGRLVYYKGFEYLIRAMSGVDGTLLIVGEGPLRLTLENLAARTGVADRVHFLGKISKERLVAAYHAASVFSLPSVARSEAFGIVQIEAMAAGLPVVNTDLDSGVPYVSLHEKTGLTVRAANSGALARAISRLLDDEPLRRTFGAAARLRARQEFSLAAMSSRTAALYQRLLEC